MSLLILIAALAVVALLVGAGLWLQWGIRRAERERYARLEEHARWARQVRESARAKLSEAKKERAHGE